VGLVESPLGGLVLALAGFILLAITVAWALSPARRTRRPQLLAALASAAVVFLLNMLAKAVGIWEWYGYHLPMMQQLGMLFALPSVLFTLVLGGYRQLELRTRRPLLVYALIAAIILVPVTVGGDLYTMNRGNLAFGRGYTIFADVLVGQALVWLPVVLYLLFRRALGGLTTHY